MCKKIILSSHTIYLKVVQYQNKICNFENKIRLRIINTIENQKIEGNLFPFVQALANKITKYLYWQDVVGHKFIFEVYKILLWPNQVINSTIIMVSSYLLDWF